MIISPYVYPGMKFEDLPIKPSKKFRDYSVKPEVILNVIAETFGLTTKDITSKSRKIELSEARHMFCGIARNHYKYQFKKIGQLMGDRHHTTAINSVYVFNNRYEVEEGYKELIKKIIINIDYYNL